MRYPLLMVILAGLLSLSALPAAAEPGLAVDVGFAGRFVLGRMALVQITVSGIERPFPGYFRIVHAVGNAWRGEASILLEIPLPAVTNGQYEQLVPLHDFTHRLQVSLYKADGSMVARAEASLRTGRREDPFPVLVGTFPTRFVAGAVTVAPEALPRAWFAYEGVCSLWIGRTRHGGPTAEQWEAISRWILAGGTLVLFGGTDFYFLDSPLLRDLLPLLDPSLTEDENGILTLSGRERLGVRRLIERSYGRTPLLLARDHGAGTVLLATVSAFDLTDADMAAVAELAPPAELVSLAGVNASLLREMEIDRPGFPAALLVLFLSLAGLSFIAPRTGRPGGSPHKTRLIALVALFLLLSLSSGFYLNRMKVANHVYLLKTSFHLDASLGYRLSQYGLFVAHPALLHLPVGGLTAVIEDLPSDLRDGDYDSLWVGGEGLSLRLTRGAWRSLRGGGESAHSVRVYFAGNEQAEIENGLDGPLSEAYLVIDGEAFPLGEVNVGWSAHTLDRSLPVDKIDLRNANLQALFAVVEPRYNIGTGVWLIGGTVEDSVTRRDGVRLKVRDVSLHIVAGGIDD